MAPPAGATGSINLVEIGGDARAHTITNSKVTGNLYCQTGSGNKNAGGGTISCNTSQSDLPIIDLPISDAEIADWETDAAAGGTITGNTTISSPTTMGPKKIVGDLIINDMLTLNNTLWVTGHIIISGNGAGIKLAPSYLASSGVIISDGYIDISNNVTFQDSGTAGSYILLLSNSTCDASTCSGNNAIDVGNNSSIIIANAEKGTVYFSNVSGVKEAVGRTIHLKNNSSITYGSGLIDVNFTSGPTGGYNVVDWGEIQ